MGQPLRFHWSLSQAGDPFRRTNSVSTQQGLTNLEAQLDLCRQAEICGIDSMLMAVGFGRPDPLLLATRLGMATDTIRFMVACRSGLLSPTFFVHQLNTVSAILNGRICINIVCGHTPHELRYYGDFLSHDERYERTDEFLTVCRRLWQEDSEVELRGKHFHVENGKLHTPFVSCERTEPEIFLGGHSPQAEALAVKHADCLWRFADTPEKLQPHIRALRAHGTELGLLVSLIARPSRKEALHAAHTLIQGFGDEVKDVHRQFAQRSDSVGFRATYGLAANATMSAWLTPTLWTGAVPYLGAPAIALVGAYDDIAAMLMTYKRLGISQFLFTARQSYVLVEYS